MSSIPGKAVPGVSVNVYGGVKASSGTLVFMWALLCLFALNRIESRLWSVLGGAVYYFSLITLCIFLFKGIGGYLAFPEDNGRLPVFIGHKPDTILVYPLLLMATIGVLGKLCTTAGIYPASLPVMKEAEEGLSLLPLRLALLPAAAFAEETLNLVMVSCFYTYIKLPEAPRLIFSTLASAMCFGLLHSFAWGLRGAAYTGIAYLPVFLTTLYTGNIWISLLAHLYNNIIAFTGAYYSGSQKLLLLPFMAVPAVWAVATIVRKR